MYIQHLRFIAFIVFTALLYIGCGDSNPVDSEDEHFEAIGFIAVFEEDTVVKYKDGVVTGQFNIFTGTTTPIYQLLFLEENGNIGVPPTDEWSLGWEINDVSVSDMVSTQEDHDLYQIQLSGLKQGQTTIVIQILHNDHKDFESEFIPIVVGESDPRPKK